MMKPPVAVITRCTAAPHRGHSVSAASLMACCHSNWPQFGQE